jgi:hypothetical protein
MEIALFLIIIVLLIVIAVRSGRRPAHTRGLGSFYKLPALPREDRLSLDTLSLLHPTDRLASSPP